MATKEGYYGSDDTSNTFKGNGTNWFTLVNKKEGDIDLYEDVLEDDKRAGTIFSKSGNLEFNPNWFDQDLKHKAFINDNIKLVKNAASETIKKGLLAADSTLSPEAAGNKSKNLTKSNKADEGGTDNKNALSNPTTIDSIKLGKSEPGTREDGFGIHVFPTTLRTGNDGQDFLKIDMMAFKPTKLKGSMSLGEGQGSASLGISDRDPDRQSIGTVILPIPGGIQDSQQVTWNEDTINPMQLALANIALDTIGKSVKEGAQTASDLVKSALKSDDTKTALGTYIASQATGGATNLLTRTTGAIMNPNMELLFSAPNIRNFSFAFTLAPRSREEAKTVIKIIRFFKQGMSPIRSKSRLFLKSPHTFRLAYKRNGSESSGFGVNDHPYLNKFKECAMGSFNVNYTPNGAYSTYDDGVMTAYQINMNFREMNPIYNDDYGNTTFPSEIGF
jgi:hypothetical protein